MKNNKLKIFYLTTWSIIFIVSLLLLIENIRYIRMETTHASAKVAENNKEFDMDSSSLHTDIPIMNYVADQVNGENHNFILDTLAKVFPINQYAADAAQDYKGIEDKKNSGLLTDILGIIDSIQSNKDNIQEEETQLPDGILPIDIINGNVEYEGIEETKESIGTQEVIGSINGEHFTLEQLLNRQFLYNNFYIVDSTTVVSDELFDANVLVGKDLSIEKNQSEPQILIYHTHSQETFSNSRPGEEDDTVVGVGNRLEQILTQEYGYNVIHDKTKYDVMGDGLDRNLAYNYARDGITKILAENPSIQVIIDVHRDGGKKRVTKINGKDTAQIMLFNGISTNSKGESISRLPNPNLQSNLAFSLQLQLKGREKFPGLMFKNYLKALRYNLHFRERSILAEVGTNNNTVEEAKNSMNYLAAILDDVLSGKE